MEADVKVDTKTYHIAVTPYDIVNGLPCSSRLCPIALALRRAVANNFARIAVIGSTMSIADGDGYFVASQYENTAQIFRFIKEFDQGVRVGLPDIDVDIVFYKDLFRNKNNHVKKDTNREQ